MIIKYDTLGGSYAEANIGEAEIAAASDGPTGIIVGVDLKAGCGFTIRERTDQIGSHRANGAVVSVIGKLSGRARETD